MEKVELRPRRTGALDHKSIWKIWQILGLLVTPEILGPLVW